MYSFNSFSNFVTNMPIALLLILNIQLSKPNKYFKYIITMMPLHLAISIIDYILLVQILVLYIINFNSIPLIYNYCCIK